MPTDFEEVSQKGICILDNKLYFYAGRRKFARESVGMKVVNFDERFKYRGLNKDFGPFNISQITEYCREMHDLMSGMNVVNNKHDRSYDRGSRLLPSGAAGTVALVLHCDPAPRNIANQIVLMSAFLISTLNFRAIDVAHLFSDIQKKLLPFRDCGVRPSVMDLTIEDVARALELAVKRRWWDWRQFDIDGYRYFGDINEGDLNWVLPGRILAMSSPSSYKTDGGLAPALFLDFFATNRVASVVRLNEKLYDHGEFENHGVRVYDLEYPDGSNPSDEIIVKFVRLCDREITAGRALAVHCRAGLGRTGTLIGLYIMHKYGASAKEAIAWLRLCRQGSVVGDQQTFMEQMEGARLAELFNR